MEKEIECIHGHFPISRFYGVFANARYVTFLRDPLMRHISGFHHHKNKEKPDNGNPTARQIWEGKLAVADFLRKKYARNVYKWYVDNSLDKFDFIGITEFFDESVKLFKKKFPQFKRMEPICINASGEKAMNVEQHYPDIVSDFKKSCIDDYRLYNAAKENFIRECERFNIDLTEPVQRQSKLLLSPRTRGLEIEGIPPKGFRHWEGGFLLHPNAVGSLLPAEMVYPEMLFSGQDGFCALLRIENPRSQPVRYRITVVDPKNGRIVVEQDLVVQQDVPATWKVTCPPLRGRYKVKLSTAMAEGATTNQYAWALWIDPHFFRKA
jgi:hypothetical protein